MAVSQADHAIHQGDDYTATVNVWNADGTPVNLTGYTAKSQIRRGYADADPVVAAEFTTSIASPLVLLTLGHAQTVTLNGQYVWDLQLTGTGGEIVTIVRGKVVVTAEVTRATA